MRNWRGWRRRSARLHQVDGTLLPVQNTDFPDRGKRFLASQLAVTPREHIETNITRLVHGDVDVLFKQLLLIIQAPRYIAVPPDERGSSCDLLLRNTTPFAFEIARGR